MMIPHHAQAVEMSDMMLKKQNVPAEGDGPGHQDQGRPGPGDRDHDRLAERLERIHTDALGPQHGRHDERRGHEKLGSAQGAEAAGLFLKQMIAHHEGAIMMAKTENTAGKNADAVKLSKDFVTAQEAEIEEMQKLVATHDGLFDVTNSPPAKSAAPTT
jgi:uncharacterized protein (DUF305 family)